jgi:hypothetical protein
MKLTVEQVLNLQVGLDECYSMRGDRFSDMVIKNKGRIDKLANEIRTKIAKIVKPTKAYEKFDVERDKLAQSFAEKNEDGTPKMKKAEGRMVYNILDTKGFEKAAKELQKKHKEAIDKRKLRLRNRDEFMKKESLPSTS